ncbi:Phenylacetate-coenzyme A ligase [Methanolapillus millepedarum]|uniref:Phenylacetate-coenzyme A ligase n=1 Tax=Methanolapillus millepedarum TaxID=3028296 RepID=A0AA96V1R4_9EURY|nr:Phenylacetate-coenzyme A ligase [Methanosarcinaceae archaeon Ac7]
MTYWDSHIETMNRKEMNELQLKRLQNSAKTVYQNVPFYKKKFDELGVKPEDIKSLSDISKLPQTTKYDFTDNYPYGLFAAPMEDIIRIHSSSGTSGKPKVVGYT